MEELGAIMEAAAAARFREGARKHGEFRPWTDQTNYLRKAIVEALDGYNYIRMWTAFLEARRPDVLAAIKDTQLPLLKGYSHFVACELKELYTLAESGRQVWISDISADAEIRMAEGAAEHGDYRPDAPAPLLKWLTEAVDEYLDLHNYLWMWRACMIAQRVLDLRSLNQKWSQANTLTIATIGLLCKAHGELKETFKEEP